MLNFLNLRRLSIIPIFTPLVHWPWIGVLVPQYLRNIVLKELKVENKKVPQYNL